MTFILPDLPYDRDALAPTVSGETLDYHHGKHHKTYVETLNKLLEEIGSTPGSLEAVVQSAGPGKLFNNAAQAWNHGFFWESMAPSPGKPAGALAEAIEAFGGLKALGEKFVETGVGQFGSGWVWLLWKDGALAVESSHDAANPLANKGGVEGAGFPLLVCDVWEHAYYLDHQNDRKGFLTAWFDRLANWDFAAGQLAAAQGDGEGYRYPPPKALAAALLLSLPAGLVAAPVLAAADQPTAPPIKYRERVLSNGLRVISSVDRSTPNDAVPDLDGDVGKDDPEGRTGFAHLFEHLMFKATRDLPSEAFDRMTEDVGGENNAFTADDMTAYYELVPAHHLERLLWAESQRLGSLVVDEANFKSERDVVKEELRQRVLANPYGRFQSLLVPSASYTTHPYRRPVIGSIEDLDSATIDDVLAFHAAYYRPDNAALIV
eukprot:gene18003-17850_t